MKCTVLLIFVAGLSVTITFDDLSLNKKATQLHTRPQIGTNTAAISAVDGDADTCMGTNEIGSNSPDKWVWWKVDLGAVYSIYSIDILFRNYDGYETRQQGRFAGFSLYVSNTDVLKREEIQASILCYKDGPNLPSLNFTTICIKQGRYVIFYNERIQNVKYPNEYKLESVFTELCNVVVHGCNEAGVYGSGCKLRCPTNCKYNTCHILNGTCYGCTPGWRGVSCDTACRKGWHGVNCSQQCAGHCRNESTCNHVTGQCDGGCEAGWTGTECEKRCENGTYGYNCLKNCSGNCLNGYPCNKKTGRCDNGCEPGYSDTFCSKKCLPGYFGMACKEKCSGYCIDKQPCDFTSGECTFGCQDGYIGKECNMPCKSGEYGKKCAFQCAENCNGPCGHIDGSCQDCKAGWKGFNCTEECVLSFGYNCQQKCNENCINRTCNKVNGSCLHGCKGDNTCKLGESGTGTTVLPNTSWSSTPVIVGGVVGTFVVLIIGIIMAVFILRLKRKAKLTTKEEFIALEAKPHISIKPSHNDDPKNTVNMENSRMQSIYALPEKTKRGPPSNKNIAIRNIKAHIANMSSNENAGFKSEYQDIPRGDVHPCTEGKKPENKVKNRYTTIFPYDHSRIILKTLTSDGSGYINANFIEDTRGMRLYIATQGPKPKTIADFWTMIWQEDVCNIVCLTNLREGTKNKCAQYWPDINDKLQGGTLTVRHLEEKTYAEYVTRRFKIHNKSTRSDRHVTMFHYTTWSDHGVADPLGLVVFHRHVIRANANSAGKYTVVHCSAGVGRTGTYIALDALYREGERTGKINVPMYVRTMRKDRMNMIQGDDQYKLLYLALKDAFHGQNKCVDTEKFLGEYQEQTCYTNCGDLSQKKSVSSDLEELLSLRKEYTQQDYISGRAQISANYTESVLPVEEFMCHLYYMKGYNTYYNAVLIKSFLEKDSLISAQYPLPNNTEDFLRLIKDFDASIVVFLCPLEDIESTSKWFPPENQHKFNGIFYVKNMSSARSHNVKLTRLNIQPTGFNEMDITLLECPTWGERLKKGDKRVLLDVVKAVKTEKSDQKGRVLVLSRDGATRCGPFFVIYNVLEQISVDREVDIFTAVRQIQIRRPECVSTLDDYKLCHDAVAEYLLNDCVYGNC